MQTTAVYRNSGSLFSCARDFCFTMLERPLEKQGMVVLVSDINDPLFFDLRNYVIAHSCGIWTKCMVPEIADKLIFDRHYVPNEILRIKRKCYFPIKIWKVSFSLFAEPRD